MKKVISLVIAAMLVMTLAAGCGGQEQSGGGATSAQAAGSESAGGTTGAELSPITFTMFTAESDAYPDNFQSPVAQEITKRTGVTLEIEYTVGSDEGRQKLSLMAASGDYPDFVYAKDKLNIIKDVEGIIKLDDLIDQYGPNVKSFYGDSIKRLRWSKDDPSIYYIGGQELGTTKTKPENGFEIQLGVLKELGYPQIKTLQDFENVIKQYLAKYPTKDGQPTIGWTICGDGNNACTSVTNPANFVTGASDDGEWYVDINNYGVTRHLARPEEKEYFKWVNHMYNTGLLDPESFTQKFDDYKAKIASGRVVALTEASWRMDESVKALKSEGKYENTYAFFPITMTSDEKYADLQSPGYKGGWGIAITKNCKDPERAMKFFNWLCSEEGQILTHWGIEGQDYTVENGKRVMKPEIAEMQRTDPKFTQTTGISKYRYPFPSYGNAIKDSTGQYFEPFNTEDKVIAEQSGIEKEVLSNYKIKTWLNLYPSMDEFPVKPWSAAWLLNVDNPDWKAAENKILETGFKLIPAAVMAKPEDFDKKWDEFMKTWDDLGLKEHTAEFEKVVKEKVDLWK